MCIRQIAALLRAAASSAPASRSARTSLIMLAPACSGGDDDLGLAGVDGDRYVGVRGQRFDDRRDTPDFFVAAHRRRAGPSRFAADIDDARALLDHRHARVRSRRSKFVNLPPSENESGVTLRMPMTMGVERSRL